MITEKKFPMTASGKEKLQEELEFLKTVKRKEVVERIKIARSYGDLSENSEYDSAKEDQAFVEGKNFNTRVNDSQCGYHYRRSS